MPTMITLTCTNCDKQFEREYQHRDRKTCSKVCRYASLRVDKPVLTAEQRLANEMLRRQRSAASRKGQVVSPERRAKISATLKRRYATGEITSTVFERTPEWKASISAGVVQAYKDGRLDPTGCYKNKWHVYEGINGVINMRSGTEVLFAENLDALSLRWQYEPERFDLGWSTYTPDFHVTDLDLWVEVKGFWKPEALRKVREFSADHNISVFMARPILRHGSLPGSVVDLFAGNCDIDQVAIPSGGQMPSSEEVKTGGK